LGKHVITICDLTFLLYRAHHPVPRVQAYSAGIARSASRADAILVISQQTKRVVGDAAVLVDPHDTEGLAEAMYCVLSNAELREDLSQGESSAPSAFLGKKRLARL
jgi:glycosyltransferase involved in cell wall biosynthesis